MNKNISSDFAARFAAMSTSSLVESFNAQVGNHGFNSARASHDIALIDKLTARGVDVSAIYNNERISFANKVVLDKITHINNKSVFTSALVNTDLSNIYNETMLGVSKDITSLCVLSLFYCITFLKCKSCLKAWTKR